MDEEKRLQKLQSGKEKLAAYRRKKRRRRAKLDGEDTASESEVTGSETSSVIDTDDIGFSSESDHDSLDDNQAKQDNAAYMSPMKLARMTDKLQKATSRVTELEENLMGKQLALDNLLEEYEQLRQQNTATPHNMEAGESQASYSADLELKKEISLMRKQIQELEAALASSEMVVKDLRGSLEDMTENRDSLQTEYMEQAGFLAQQVHTLQGQLKQADQWLGQPGGQNIHMDVLLEAKNELLALQESHRVKDQQMLALQDALKQRDRAMSLLVSQKPEHPSDPRPSADIRQKLEEYFILKQRDEKNRQLLAELQQENEALKKRDKENGEVVRKLMEDVEFLRKGGAAGVSYGEDILTNQEHLKLLDHKQAELEERHGEQVTMVKQQISELWQRDVEKLRKNLNRAKKKKVPTATLR